MREKKFKQVKIDCYFDIPRSHYGEEYTDISQKQLEEEIEKLFGFGWRVLKITADGKSWFLKLTKKTNANIRGHEKFTQIHAKIGLKTL